LLLAVPFGPLLAWKRGDVLAAAQRLTTAFGAGLLGIAVTLWLTWGGPVLAPFAVGLALYVMIGALADVVERSGVRRVPAGTALRRAAGLPRSAWGTTFAHFGLGMTLLGVVAESSWNTERIVTVKPKDTVSISSYELTFEGMTTRQGPNYRELLARFTVRSGGDVVGTLDPSKRTFQARATSTTEAALLTRGFSQIYLSLGDPNPDGSLAIRLYHKPLVLLIWLGTLVMVLGGVLSLSDRRLRVGAPKPARKTAALQPAE
jgi:cytochrome c-type biogenesis protein CcmF